MDGAIVSAFIVYFCILTAIGYYFYHTTRSETDFILANRSINYWVTAIATQASDMSSWLFLGFPAAVYMNGIFELWTAIGLVVGMFLNWHYIAPRLRIATQQYHSVTLASFFAHRFPAYATSLALVSSCMAILFFTFYIGASLAGLGHLFSSVLEIHYSTGTMIGLLFAILYTLLGGFVAVAWCDLFQGIFLLAMIVLVPLCGYYAVGGWTPIVAALHAKDVPLSLIPTWQDAGYSILLAAGWGLGYFGQPHILTNFMAIDDVHNIRYAKRVGITWQIIVLTAAACIGLIGVAYTGDVIINPEDIFIMMAKGLLPSFLAGCALCGILAATLSTLDSHILISGSIVAQDVCKKLLGWTVSERAVVHISRVGSILVSIMGLIIAQSKSSTIYYLANYAWAGLGSSFGPLVIMSLYFPQKVRGSGAVAGILVGGIVSALWPYVNVTVLPLVPGFLSGLIAIWLISAMSE